MCTLEIIIKSSENFPGVFEVNQRGKDLGIYELHGEAKEKILKNENSEAVGAITNETFPLSTATSWRVASRGGARHFHLGGPLEGPVLQQVELSMVCVGLSERDLLRLTSRGKFWGSTGGQAKFLGAVAPPGTPLAPPLVARDLCLDLLPKMLANLRRH